MLPDKLLNLSVSNEVLLSVFYPDGTTDIMVETLLSDMGGIDAYKRRTRSLRSVLLNLKKLSDHNAGHHMCNVSCREFALLQLLECVPELKVYCAQAEREDLLEYLDIYPASYVGSPHFNFSMGILGPDHRDVVFQGEYVCGNCGCFFDESDDPDGTNERNNKIINLECPDCLDGDNPIVLCAQAWKTFERFWYDGEWFHTMTDGLCNLLHLPHDNVRRSLRWSMREFNNAAFRPLYARALELLKPEVVHRKTGKREPWTVKRNNHES